MKLPLVHTRSSFSAVHLCPSGSVLLSSYAFSTAPRLSPTPHCADPPPPELDSEAEPLHPARQLRVVGFVPRRRRRRLGSPAICLEELGDVLSRGTSGLCVDRRGSGMAPVLCSRQAQRGKSYLYLCMLVLTCPIRLTTWEPTSFHPCMCSWLDHRSDSISTIPTPAPPTM